MLAVDAMKTNYNEEISNENYSVRPVVSLPSTTILEFNEEKSSWTVK